MSAYKIRYCAHSDIDKIKWNRCIEEADNGLIYASSTYLDIMAGKWDAMVLNDYEAVMPLTWNRKYSLYYLYQPYFIPSLGVFGKKRSSLAVLDFLAAIPGKFCYWDIDLNETNYFLRNDNLKLNTTTRIHYQLSLGKPYNETRAVYKKL